MYKVLQAAQRAKKASYLTRVAPSREKDNALLRIAEVLRSKHPEILQANLLDLKIARAAKAAPVILDRLSLERRFDEIVHGVEQIVQLQDPVGEILEKRTLQNGMQLQKKRVPIGVLAVIYEARPNVTVDAAALALKSGNAALLRGGKETFHTNTAIVEAIQTALAESSLPQEALAFIPPHPRSLIEELLRLDSHIDMIIPRGGKSLHHLCLQQSRIPVITGGIGICHLFVDASANFERACEVVVNAKTDRPSVCNALDTLLVHKEIASSFLPPLILRLQSEGVSFRLDSLTWEMLQPQSEAFQKAVESDWQTEWLSLTLGIKVVDSLQEALEHIQTYSSGHSDGILTNTRAHAKAFMEAVDSAAVYVNASTRFTDGGQWELGAEVAISTQKLHARGPVGLKELTTYKWIIEGDYHIRRD